jgi:hypothetical protein
MFSFHFSVSASGSLPRQVSLLLLLTRHFFENRIKPVKTASRSWARASMQFSCELSADSAYGGSNFRHQAANHFDSMQELELSYYEKRAAANQ